MEVSNVNGRNSIQRVVPVVSKKLEIKKEVKLAMLNCEMNPPYGPGISIAKMFAELISNAVSLYHSQENLDTNLTEALKYNIIIKIDIYEIQKFEYPATYFNEDESDLSLLSWDAYDGILMPGSISCAYDESKEWITMFRKVVLEEIHGKERKTLGICFGHQILANADEVTNVIACPVGNQAGVISCHLLAESESALNFFSCANLSTNAKFLFTHGDMVCQLPSSNAILLAKSDHVPCQVIAYKSYEGNGWYAFSFQAHLEYAASEHGKATYKNVLELMGDKQHISRQFVNQCQIQVEESWLELNLTSTRLVMDIATTFGWF